jgi:cation transport regulator ChaC
VVSAEASSSESRLSSQKESYTSYSDVSWLSLIALGFVANQQSKFYSGKLPLDEVAEVLSRAAGHWGSCAEYLRETVAHLEERGIRDANLWRLQALVAERLKTMSD